MQLPSIQLVWHGKGTSASRRAYAERLATASRGPTRRHIAIDEALLAEARPVFVECFERAAIALSPMRCAGASCPYRAERNAGGGCAATDAKGRTTAPPGWPYAPGMPDAQQRRCLGGSCITGPQPGSGAWAHRRS